MTYLTGILPFFTSCPVVSHFPCWVCLPFLICHLHFSPSPVCILTWDSYHLLYEIQSSGTSHGISCPLPGVTVPVLFLVTSPWLLVSHSSMGCGDTPKLPDSHTSTHWPIGLPFGLVANGWKRNIKARIWEPGLRGSFLSLHFIKDRH